MKNAVRFILCVISGAMICFAGMYVGYLIFAPKERNIEYVQAQEVVSEPEPVISEQTNIIYEYCTVDGETERTRDKPPYFLIGKTREETGECLEQWSIEKFSENEVILKRFIDSKLPDNYIIGNYDGFVAVYSDDKAFELEEVTDTPIESLSEDEQKRLLDGISVNGGYELIRCLENYSS